MTIYIGTKAVRAFPMNRLAYNQYRGWELPGGEDGSDEGYLVEYLNQSEPNHPNHDGYISWSPADVFGESYKQQDGTFSFGVAIALLKCGHLKLARKGWNGKGMFLYYVPPGEYTTRTQIAVDTFGDKVAYGAYVAMKTADGTVVPWLASQTDLLAEDWEIVE